MAGGRDRQHPDRGREVRRAAFGRSRAPRSRRGWRHGRPRRARGRCGQAFPSTACGGGCQLLPDPGAMICPAIALGRGGEPVFKADAFPSRTGSGDPTSRAPIPNRDPTRTLLTVRHDGSGAPAGVSRRARTGRSRARRARAPTGPAAATSGAMIAGTLATPSLTPRPGRGPEPSRPPPVRAPRSEDRALRARRLRPHGAAVRDLQPLPLSKR